MNRTSFELAKLETPISAIKTNEIADIYKDSTLLLNVCQFDYSHFELISIISGFIFINCEL
jgi:hypothetical protein